MVLVQGPLRVEGPSLTLSSKFDNTGRPYDPAYYSRGFACSTHQIVIQKWCLHVYLELQKDGKLETKIVGTPIDQIQNKFHGRDRAETREPMKSAPLEADFESNSEN